MVLRSGAINLHLDLNEKKIKMMHLSTRNEWNRNKRHGADDI